MENYDRRRREAQDEPGQGHRSGSHRDEERGSWREKSRDDIQRYGSPDYGARERDETARGRRHGGGREDQPEYGRQGQGADRERPRFSPDWSREGAEPRQSDEPYYARNRDRDGRSDDTARTDWPYEAGDRGRDRQRSIESEPESHYRGYYRRSSTPFSYPGGRGELFAESWTLTGPYAGRGPKGYKRSDQQIIEDACQRLERDGDVDASEIEVTAEDGVIRLRGTVSDRRTKRRAEDCVESVYGARDVMNELRVAAQGQGEGDSGRRASGQRTRGARSSAGGTTSPTPPSSTASTTEENQQAPKH